MIEYGMCAGPSSAVTEATRWVSFRVPRSTFFVHVLFKRAKILARTVYWSCLEVEKPSRIVGESRLRVVVRPRRCGLGKGGGDGYKGDEFDDSLVKEGRGCAWCGVAIELFRCKNSPSTYDKHYLY